MTFREVSRPLQNEYTAAEYSGFFMGIMMTKPSKDFTAFMNRAKLIEAKQKAVTDCCDDVVFILKDKHHEFSLSLATLLQCLKLAEEQGLVPELPERWQGQGKYNRPSPSNTSA